VFWRWQESKMAEKINGFRVGGKGVERGRKKMERSLGEGKGGVPKKPEKAIVSRTVTEGPVTKRRTRRERMKKNCAEGP